MFAFSFENLHNVCDGGLAMKGQNDSVKRDHSASL